MVHALIILFLDKISYGEYILILLLTIIQWIVWTYQFLCNLLIFFSDCTCLCNMMFSDNVEVDSFTSTITKSMYHPVSISTIVDTQTHHSVEGRKKISVMLNKHRVLFDGILKVYPHQLVHLDIIPNATPFHLHAYPMANIHLDVFKAKLSCLFDIGVLENVEHPNGHLQHLSSLKKMVAFDGSLTFKNSIK